jgi:choline dehydrogenase-like flavoprotein
MYVDARHVPTNTSIDTDLCIIGAGVAGITLASRLASRQLRVCLIEGGGFKRQDRVQDLYRGDNVGLDYELLEEARSRFFGGSSNCWGGWCRPLDELDFERRDWVPNSGWPFRREALATYYEEAHRLLALGPFDYTPETWYKRIGRPEARLLPLDPAKIASMIVQFSPPLRFGEAFRSTFGLTRDVQVLLHANACELLANGEASRVDRLRVRTLEGNEFHVTAGTFVLAMGGIENARLLLLSNGVSAAGLGNEHDLVGRYFMDHPRLRLGRVRFAPGWRHVPLYDVKYCYHSEQLSAGGVSVAAHLAPTARLQQRERLLNARVYVASVFPGEALLHLPDLLATWRHLRRAYPSLAGNQVARGLRQAHRLAYHFYARLHWPPSLIQHHEVESVVEPVPDPDSRVSLSPERDALGLNRARLDWRVGELERRTLGRVHRLIDGELRAAGIGALESDLDPDRRGWPERLGWCWHHMGTTRMDDDPRRGVVDRNCRVHRVGNLYVAGSSVFPTCGSDTPTVTIVALALRLADRILAGLQVPGHEAGAPPPSSPQPEPRRAGASPSAARRALARLGLGRAARRPSLSNG